MKYLGICISFEILRTEDEILLSKVFISGKFIKDRASAGNLIILLSQIFLC